MSWRLSHGAPRTNAACSSRGSWFNRASALFTGISRSDRGSKDGYFKFILLLSDDYKINIRFFRYNSKAFLKREANKIKTVQSEKFHILIAEDEKDIGDILLEVLSQAGREITLVNNGSDALNKLREGRYDLLITDLMMPDVDGMEVLKTAKSLYPDILVIIMTGYASIETAIEAVKQGAYDYIRKPFRLEEFKISVDNACEKIRLRRENQLLLEGLKNAMESAKNEENRGKDIDQDLNSQVNVFAPAWAPSLSYGEGRMSGSEMIQEIERLADLFKKGLIDESEFKALKKELFKRI